LRLLAASRSTLVEITHLSISLEPQTKHVTQATRIDMTDVATVQDGAVTPLAAQDQTVASLNADSANLVDSALGFGFLEGKVKQQVTKIKSPTPFCSHMHTDAKFESVEDMSTAKGAFHFRKIAQFADLNFGCISLHGEHMTEKHGVKERTAVMFFFKRVIAMRSIPTPRYADLIPVRRKIHLHENRWLVERFGNEVCIAEQYGGLAYISFTWNRKADLSASKFISEIETTVASGKLSTELMQSSEKSQMSCYTNVKGFALPDTSGGSLTSVNGGMNLIRSLNQLPIPCAVPVGTVTVPIQNTFGFPYGIDVETQIRDEKKLEKLTDLLLRLERTGHRNTSTFEFVEYLLEKIEDASMSKRSLLPELTELVGSVTQTLANHGKCVELYERDGKYQLHTDDCDEKSVTASASEIMCYVTFGLAIPATREYQRSLFSKADSWTIPQHYEARQFANTYAVAGYYDRVKVRLFFKDDALVSEWRSKVANLFASPRRHRIRRWLNAWGA
jgi:hypothetical protein